MTAVPAEVGAAVEAAAVPLAVAVVRADEASAAVRISGTEDPALVAKFCHCCCLFMLASCNIFPLFRCSFGSKERK